MARKKRGVVGSSFDAFLAEQGILEECEEQAIEQILADRVRSAMAGSEELDGHSRRNAKIPGLSVQ